MSTITNIDRLTRYIDQKTANWNQKPDINHLYSDCYMIFSTQPQKDYTLLCFSPSGDLSYTSVTLCAGSNGIAYRITFPIHCISESEERNLEAFVKAFNKEIPMGHLFMENGCLYWTMGVNTEQMSEKNRFYHVALFAYCHPAIEMLGKITPFILSAMLGEDADVLARQAVEICTRPAPQEEVDEEEARIREQEEHWLEEHPEERWEYSFVQAWEIDLPDVSDVPELAGWMRVLKKWACQK